MNFCKPIKNTRILLLALFLCVCATQAHASAAAVVLFSHGSAHVINAHGQRQPLAKGDGVLDGDTVTTGRNGRIQMRFSDGGLVSLMPGSKFVVEDYQQPTTASDGSLVFNLVEGGLRTLTGSIGDKDHGDYKLKTSVATLGIRGTQFVVVMDGDVMRIHVGHGKVAVFNDSGRLFLVGGENGIVMPGKKPERTDLAPNYVSAAEAYTGGVSGNQAGRNTGNDPDSGSTSTDRNLPAQLINGSGAESGDTPDGDTPDGDTPGGDTPGGDTPDGDTPGGDTPGGDTPGGDTPGGDTPGGDTPGGDTPGGDTPGGDTPGGDTPGGDTPGGDTPGGDTPGGDTPGGDTPGGDTPGGDTPGGDTPGGDMPGGDTPGGDTPGGDTPGGDTPGGDTPDGGTTANPGFAVAYRTADGGLLKAKSYSAQQWQQAVQDAGGALPASVPAFLPVKPDTPIADIQPNPPTINITGDLVWGEVLARTNDTGTFKYYQPYVWGIPTANVPSSGTLRYALTDATAVRYISAGVSSSGTLNQFLLTIDLNGAGGPLFRAALGMEVDSRTLFLAMPSSVAGKMDGASFKFGSDLINNEGCNNCLLSVSGLLSGANAEQAGVVYKLLDHLQRTDADVGVATGAAVLRKLPPLE